MVVSSSFGYFHFSCIIGLYDPRLSFDDTTFVIFCINSADTGVVHSAALGRERDGLFGLHFADDTAAYFVLEVDRGTIPLTRTDVRGTDAWRKSIAYKLATYWEGWKPGQHETQFGVKQMRVAMVTSSPERVEHMLDLVQDLTDGKGTNFFLFVDRREACMTAGSARCGMGEREANAGEADGLNQLQSASPPPLGRWGPCSAVKELLEVQKCEITSGWELGGGRLEKGENSRPAGPAWWGALPVRYMGLPRDQDACPRANSVYPRAPPNRCG